MGLQRCRRYAAETEHRGTIQIMQKEISVAEFVARPIALLEEVSMTREEIVIVRDGKPLGKLVPIPHSEKTLDELRNLHGRVPGDTGKLDEDAIARRNEGLKKLRGSVKILGDIVEPIDWNEIE
jgi:antitoxin (DNA-binding transcriptional repressor) of toxin-antitoxin stability system